MEIFICLVDFILHSKIKINVNTIRSNFTLMIRYFYSNSQTLEPLVFIIKFIVIPVPTDDLRK